MRLVRNARAGLLVHCFQAHRHGYYGCASSAEYVLRQHHDLLNADEPPYGDIHKTVSPNTTYQSDASTQGFLHFPRMVRSNRSGKFQEFVLPNNAYLQMLWLYQLPTAFYRELGKPSFFTPFQFHLQLTDMGV
ncbi:MAG: hypothetical protein MUF71_19960 [Candidatus Kapabacteria bacterium]|nr:hypothetical protein [Candidatus Kapabacteria bacterium]